MKAIRLHTLELPLSVMAAVMAGLLGLACAVADSRSAQVDAVFGEYDKPDSPGCALGIIQDGNLIYKHGYGMASLEHGAPISGDTVFRIGSLSKQFTAAAVALLAEDGKISLGDDVRKYLPELPAYEHPITIRHLIHHTSGLRDYTSLVYMAGIHGADNYTVAESLDLIARQRGTDFPPGEKYSYSNSGYFLLSQIVERASGRSLRAYSEERIFGPLGMKQTHFHDAPFEVVPKRAYGYSPGDDGGYLLDMTGWEQTGDGSVFTTIEDLLFWDRNFYHNRLGKGEPALIETLETVGRLNNGEAIDYAFALVVDQYRGLKRVSHGGSWVGFRTHMDRFPEMNFSVAVLCNLSTTSPGTLAHRVADIYLAGEFTEGEDGGEAESVAAGLPERVEVPEEELRRFSGHYWSESEKRAWKIDLEGGQLLYRRGPDAEVALLPLGGGRFAMGESGNAGVRFTESEGGEPRKMIVSRGTDLVIPFERFEPVSPSPEMLDQYAGTYHCEELNARYVVAMKGGKLGFAVGHLHNQPLVPLFPDVFQYPDGVTFTFGRDGSKSVDRLTLDVGRTRNIACSKL